MKNRPIRILLIDANPKDREASRACFAESDEYRYLFQEADCAEDGWHLAQSFQPDCIISEYKLPGMTGLELLRQFPTKPGGLPSAFVILTNQGDETVAVQAMKAGAHDYVSKARLGEVSLSQIVMAAIAQSKQQHQWALRQVRLERFAMMDALTGLYNRRYFEERMANEIERARRYQSQFSLLMFDLDYFKSVNDQYGHLAGDNVLSEFGGILQRCSRSSDLPARFGGEEFCLFLANTDIDGAQIMAERIRLLAAQKEVRSPSNQSIHFTCSIGVAEFHPSMSTLEELVAQADDALYAAKHAGRNRVSTHKPVSSIAL